MATPARAHGSTDKRKLDFVFVAFLLELKLILEEVMRMKPKSPKEEKTPNNANKALYF